MAVPLRVGGTFHLTLESVGRSTIVFCQGRLVWSEEGTLLKAIFFMQGCDHLTLDLARVDSIDARGLSVLATIAKWALRKRVKFVISNPTRRVFDLIRLVNLDTAIPAIPVRAIENAHPSWVSNESWRARVI
jgi:anti-anti-sigma factor